MAQRFVIDEVVRRQYRRFNVIGTQFTVRLIPPTDTSDPVGHFLASVNDLFEHALRDVDATDMVGLTIQNRVNQNDKPIGISFRRKDQLSGDVIWSVFEKVAQSNARFDVSDTLVVTVHSVKLPVGYGKHALKSKGRPLSVLAHLKKSIVEVKAEENCLAHALIIAIAKIENVADYNSYRRGRRIRPAVQQLLETTGIDLSGGAGIPELSRFQEYFREYKITVYQGVNCADKMFEGQVDTSKRINLLYDDVERHYHVITNLTGAMAIRYVCKACNRACRNYVTHVCDQTCSDCTFSPPCVFSSVRIPCDEYNRHFRSRTCCAYHKQSTSKTRCVRERRRCCAMCGGLVTAASHECHKRFCENCKQNRDVNHMCYLRPLRDALPAVGDKIL
jgi:hypothetical protein